MPLSPIQRRILVKQNPQLAVLEFMREMEDKNSKELETVKEEMRLRMEKEINARFAELVKQITGLDAFEKAGANLITMLSNIRVPRDGRDGTDGRNGIDGKDADEEFIVERVLARIPIPENGKDGESPVAGVDYPTEMQIRDMVQSMISEQDIIGKIKEQFPKLEIKGADMVKEINALPIKPEFQFEIGRIKGLEGNLRSLKRPRLGGGGGIAAGDIYTETGTISSLISLTVANSISKIMSFGANGMFLHLTTDYTFSGSTITYVTALDSSFSGKPYTITYV